MTYNICFLHANGFPGSSYRKLLEKLAAQYPVDFIDTIGHNPAFPVTDCWTDLVNEVIQYFERHDESPNIGVGHSLGGLLALYAASQRPQLFSGIIILDSPLMRPLPSFIIWLAKQLGFIQYLTPGGKRTLRRRDHWADVTMVYDYFARKPLFSHFDPDCLMDYAIHGTEADSCGGRRLKFRPAVEHSIYCTLPHNVPRYRHNFTIPAVVITGSESSVLSMTDLKWLQQNFRMELDQQTGSHLFPLEYPLDTADRILTWIPKLVNDK